MNELNKKLFFTLLSTKQITPIPSITNHFISNIAEIIRTNIESLEVIFEANSILEGLTISIGIASLEDSELNESKLFKCADRALYMAKDTGKNCCKPFVIDKSK